MTLFFLGRTDTFVLLGRGVVSSSVGGMVSLGPPDGGVDVFAHDGANSIDASVRQIRNIMQELLFIVIR